MRLTIIFLLLTINSVLSATEKQLHTIPDSLLSNINLIILMTIGKYDEVIKMNQELENFLRQNSDTITYHMRSVKRTFGRAYEAKGDYKNAMKCFDELAVLTDSLKTREQKSAALDLATAYETMEKEAEIRQKNASLQMRNLLLISAAILIALFAVILWRSIKYARTIRKKNLIMVNTINLLMEYKKEEERKNEDINIIDEPQTPPDNKTLFKKLDNIVINRKLYLDRNITREDLMKLIRVDKNRFGQIMKEETQTNISGYLNNIRLELAAKLLKENPNMGINEVAKKSAIPNTSTFYRLFKDKYGITCRVSECP